MCGILGIVSKGDVSKYHHKFEDGLHAMAHRGPDHCKKISFPNAMLGYVRLAVRGLSEQYHQPIFIGDDFYAFGNGEVYSENGIPVNDTQNDLHGLIKSVFLGDTDIYERFDADFALCCYDRKTNRVYIGRDVWGVKPLYYTWIDSETLGISSELGALLPLLSSRPMPETSVWRDYLLFGYPVSYRTFYKGIFILPPGEIWQVDLNTGKQDIWCIASNESDLDNSVASGSFESSLIQSVKDRLQSDKKVGCYLSGGLDSSMIAYIIQREGDREFECINLYRDTTDRDHQYSRGVSEDLNVLLHSKRLEEQKPYRELIQVLHSPIMSSGAFVPFAGAKMANESGLTVLLGGQGADEVMLGYHRFSSLGQTQLDVFDLLSNGSISLFTDLFSLSEDEKSRLIREYESIFTSCETGTIPKEQRFYIKFFLHELLRIEDHVHMRYSIENRVPYLSLSIRQLMNSGKLTRQKQDLIAYHRKLNTRVCSRKKENLNPSLVQELDAVKYEYLNLLSNHQVMGRLNYDKLTEIIQDEKYRLMGKKEHFLLWFLYNLHLWCVLNNVIECVYFL